MKGQPGSSAYSYQAHPNPSTSTHPAVLPVHVAVGAIADGNGAFDGDRVGDRVGTVVSAVVMEMIEAKMMTGTADFMLSDNVMLLLVVKDCSNLTHQLFITVVLAERPGGDLVRFGDWLVEIEMMVHNIGYDIGVWVLGFGLHGRMVEC